MTPAYLRDMQIIDERLTALENKLSIILKILIELEEALLCKREFTKEELSTTLQTETISS